MIFNKLQYFYYRLYSWRLRANETSMDAGTTAQVFLGIILMANAFTIAMFVELLTGYRILDYYFNFVSQFHFKKYEILIYGALFILFVEWMLQKNKFYFKLTESYKSETENERRKGTCFIWLYIVGSFSTFLIVRHFLYY